jgi:hypothetical protein
MQLSKVILPLQRAIHSSAGSGTINASEIAHFSRLSSQWWDEQGEFSFLHKMNPVRMQFIREKLNEVSRQDEGEELHPSRTLEGLDVLDVGCGGGLLSEVRVFHLDLYPLSFATEPCAPGCPYVGNRRVRVQHINSKITRLS